jgi:UV DNA damage repair endonuclease
MENNSNNNEWKVKVAEFRGFVKTRIETMEKVQVEHTKDIKEIRKTVEELNLKLAIHPQNCIQIGPMKKVQTEIQIFKDIETKRGVIKKLLLAIFSLIGGSIGYFITLFIKNKFGG